MGEGPLDSSGGRCCGLHGCIEWLPIPRGTIHCRGGGGGAIPAVDHIIVHSVGHFMWGIHQCSVVDHDQAAIQMLGQRTLKPGAWTGARPCQFMCMRLQGAQDIEHIESCCGSTSFFASEVGMHAIQGGHTVRGRPQVPGPLAKEMEQKQAMVSGTDGSVSKAAQDITH